MSYDDIYYVAISIAPGARFMFTEECEDEADEIYAFGPVEIKQKLTIILKKPIPKKIEFGDFNKAGRPVFSLKAATIIKNGFLGINQLFPAEATHKGVVYPDFYVFKPNIELEVMHKERSDYSKSDSGLSYFIDALSLDETKLDNVEEDQRWIIVLAEDPAKILYHEKVVKALEDANVIGVRFVKVSKWNTGSAFD